MIQENQNMQENSESNCDILAISGIRPLSRLDFQILYGKCASSGWVHGEFNETLFQQYIQRFGLFLYHLIILKHGKFVLNDTLIELNKPCDIFILVDKGGLLHTISLPGVSSIKGVKKNNKVPINWFFAESANTLETYVYNPLRIESQYYAGPNKIVNLAPTADWINNRIILLDFFPFPIIMSTDIRKEVVEEGYTFRKHLSEYFKPLFNSVNNLISSGKNNKTEVHIIAPPYTSVHAILELEDFEWKKLIILKNNSNYKGTKLFSKMPFGFDNDLTPATILRSFRKIRKNEFVDFQEKFFNEESNNLTQPWSKLSDNIIDKLKNPKVNEILEIHIKEYRIFCEHLKNRIYLNGANVPGQSK